MKDSKGLILIFVFLLIVGGVIIASLWGESRRKELAFEVYATVDKFKDYIADKDIQAEKITQLEKELSTQKEAIKLLTENVEKAQKERQETLESLVTNEQITALSDRIAIQEKNNLSFKAKNFVSLNTVLSLRQAIETNRPFAIERQILQKIYPDMIEWDVLKKYSETGLPTLSLLTTSFGDLMQTRSQKEEGKSESTTEKDAFWQDWGNEIERRLQNLVRIRPTQLKAEDVSPETILARVEYALNEKNLYRATDEMARLEMSAPDSYNHFKVWHQKAQDRLLVLKIIDELVMKITSQLTQETLQ